MKRLNAVWVTCLLCLFGCADENTTMIAERSGGAASFSYQITGVQLINGVLVASLETGGGERVIRIAPEQGGMQALATIEDGDTRELFALRVLYDDHEGAMTIVEYTDQDTLSMTRVHTAEDVIEAFVSNGDSLTVEYPHTDGVTMAASIEDYHAERYEEIDPKLLESFLAFDAFYDTGNSLHDNDDGKLLVSAIFDLAQSYGVGTYGCRSCIETFCAVTGVVTGIKCWFGGPLNILCDVGTPVTIACAIFTIVCVFGCGD